MSKEEYLQWAMAVLLNGGDPNEAEAFAQKLEQADRQAASLLRKVNSSVADLMAHLASVVSAEGK